MMYDRSMPKLWSDTIDAHRRDVREALLDTTAALVAEHGLRAVTMSQIAAETGIGRATLYKYFPDVESILVSWHQRKVAEHLDLLKDLSDKAPDASQALSEVLKAYALISREGHGSDLSELLHRGEHNTHAHQHLESFITDLVRRAADEGTVRADVPPNELAVYCIHAMSAASGLTSKAAVGRLVTVILSGLQP